MSRIVGTRSDALAPIIVIAAVAATLFGIYHAFHKHSSASGFASVFIPPYAWYMSAEALLWHDDYAGVDWEKRLRNDIKLTLAFSDAFATKVPIEKQQAYNSAVEKFAKTVRDYPAEKKDYLASFGMLYFKFVESFTEDFFDAIQLAMESGETLVFKESDETRDLKEKILQYDGAEEFVAAYDRMFLSGSFAEAVGVKEFLQGSNEKQKQSLKLWRLGQQQNINRMRNLYAMIFE